MKLYELMFIVQPDMEDEPREALVAGATGAVTANGGEVVHVEQMGRRRLAYPIKHRLDGFYVLLHARMEPVAITELERYLRLSEHILRYLLIQLEEKGQAQEDEQAEVHVEAEA